MTDVKTHADCRRRRGQKSCCEPPAPLCSLSSSPSDYLQKPLLLQLLLLLHLRLPLFLLLRLYLNKRLECPSSGEAALVGLSEAMACDLKGNQKSQCRGVLNFLPREIFFLVITQSRPPAASSRSRCFRQPFGYRVIPSKRP